MKTLLTTFFALIMAVSVHAVADEDTGAAYEASEVDRNWVRISNDGTGVVKNIKCEICDFKVVNVTANTMGYVGRKQMSALEALKKSKGRIGFVKYDLESREVIELRFYN